MIESINPMRRYKRVKLSFYYFLASKTMIKVTIHAMNLHHCGKRVLSKLKFIHVLLRKPCSGHKLKDITGSGIFAAESAPQSDGSISTNKTGLRTYQVFIICICVMVMLGLDHPLLYQIISYEFSS